MFTLHPSYCLMQLQEYIRLIIELLYQRYTEIDGNFTEGNSPPERKVMLVSQHITYVNPYI